jgi:hypothetical protein
VGTPVRSLFSLTAAMAAVAALGLGLAPPAVAAGWTPSAAINCGWASGLCTEVANSRSVFGYYVGHDEPSVLFYSRTPGSGNHMRYDITLPSDPSPRNPTEVGKSYQFELSGAERLGMAMCDTQTVSESSSTTSPRDSRGR